MCGFRTCQRMMASASCVQAGLRSWPRDRRLRSLENSPGVPRLSTAAATAMSCRRPRMPSLCSQRHAEARQPRGRRAHVGPTPNVCNREQIAAPSTVPLVLTPAAQAFCKGQGLRQMRRFAHGMHGTIRVVQGRGPMAPHSLLMGSYGPSLTVDGVQWPLTFWRASDANSICRRSSTDRCRHAASVASAMAALFAMGKDAQLQQGRRKVEQNLIEAGAST